MIALDYRADRKRFKEQKEKERKKKMIYSASLSQIEIHLHNLLKKFSNSTTDSKEIARKKSLYNNVILNLRLLEVVSFHEACFDFRGRSPLCVAGRAVS